MPGPIRPTCTGAGRDVSCLTMQAMTHIIDPVLDAHAMERSTALPSYLTTVRDGVTLIRRAG